MNESWCWSMWQIPVFLATRCLQGKTDHVHHFNFLVCAGLKTPDTTQYEALKLLCSLVMLLLGNGFYGAPGLNTDTQFVDQGTNKHVSPPEDDGPIIV